MRSLGTEFLEQLGLADTSPPVYNDEIVAGRLEGSIERIEFLDPIVEGHTLSNH